MHNKRVTITQLAKTLKLSTCTVSKILNRSFDGFTYSKETIKRVTSTAQVMGYVPNAQARSLRTRKTMLVALLLPSAQSVGYGYLTTALELYLRQYGYQVLIGHTQNDPEAEKELIKIFLARGVDGLLWIPTLTRIDPDELGIGSPFPTVLIERFHCKKLSFVGSNNEEASEELARRIRDMGHERIGVLLSSKNDRGMKERLKGIANIYGKSIQLVDIPNDSDIAKNATVDLLQNRNPPSAIIALSDLLAVGALAGFGRLELQVGKDISFASFDEFPLAARWSPPITLVRHEIKVIADTAVNLLLGYMKGERTGVEHLRVPATLQWRYSVAKVE